MEENQPLFELEADPSAKNSLSETSRWARLTGIVLLSFIAMLILFLLFYGSKFSEAFGDLSQGDTSQVITILVIAFVLIGGIVGTLAWFLINGAAKIKKGLQLNDQVLFNAGLASLGIILSCMVFLPSYHYWSTLLIYFKRENHGKSG